MITNAGAGTKTSSSLNVFTLTSAATPCGVSLGTALANTSSGSSSVSVCSESWGISLCDALSSRFAEKDSSKAKSGADRLLHQVHAFDGDLSLGIRRALAERAAQFLHARILAALHAPESIFELEQVSHAIPETGVYRTPR